MSMITPALAFCVWCAQERLAGAEARVRGAQARAEALAVELADVQVGARTCQRARVCTFVQTCSGPHIRTHRDTQQAQGLTGTHILKLTRPRTHTLTQARTHTHTHTHTQAHERAHTCTCTPSPGRGKRPHGLKHHQPCESAAWYNTEPCMRA